MVPSTVEGSNTPRYPVDNTLDLMPALQREGGVTVSKALKCGLARYCSKLRLQGPNCSLGASLLQRLVSSVPNILHGLVPVKGPSPDGRTPYYGRQCASGSEMLEDLAGTVWGSTIRPQGTPYVGAGPAHRVVDCKDVRVVATMKDNRYPQGILADPRIFRAVFGRTEGASQVKTWATTVLSDQWAGRGNSSCGCQVPGVTRSRCP